MDDQILIQDCGCLAIPEEIARSLGKSPGVTLKMTSDVSSRSITLTAPSGSLPGSTEHLAACRVSL